MRQVTAIIAAILLSRCAARPDMRCSGDDALHLRSLAADAAIYPLCINGTQQAGFEIVDLDDLRGGGGHLQQSEIMTYIGRVIGHELGAVTSVEHLTPVNAGHSFRYIFFRGGLLWLHVAIDDEGKQRFVRSARFWPYRLIHAVVNECEDVSSTLEGVPVRRISTTGGSFYAPSSAECVGGREATFLGAGPVDAAYPTPIKE